MSEDEQDAYNDIFLNALETWDAPQVGKLFGHAAGIGHDPREDAFVVKKAQSQMVV